MPGRIVNVAPGQSADLAATTVRAQQTTEAMNRLARQTAVANNQMASFANRGAITMDNFGKQFDNAIKKVLLWQVAIEAVYGSFKRIGEAVQQWKDFEVTLERIGITTAALSSKLDSYFKEAANVAVAFGMPLKQTIDGMDLALRATASLEDQSKRTATAVTLLKDASVLSNITGMQYAQSVDILVASLRQAGYGLDEGVKLLDKWVAVQKVAQVSVTDLSKGFSIMADAGEAAGMTIDQINGLVAALSESSGMAATEIGNSVRALMSTLYNEGSIKILQKYGVAVRDASGDLRNFWDVMQQLSALKTNNVLSEAAWLEIAKAAGAGQRRYAQFLQLLNSIPTASRAAMVSANAEGDAYSANERIVNTLTNAYDSMTAAQGKFIYELGVKSGVIDTMTTSLQTLTKVFDYMSERSQGLFTLARALGNVVTTLGAMAVVQKAWQWIGGPSALGAALLTARGRAGTGLISVEQAQTQYGLANLPLAAAVAGSKAETMTIRELQRLYPKDWENYIGYGNPLGIGSVSPQAAQRAGLVSLSGLFGNRFYNMVAARNLPSNIVRADRSYPTLASMTPYVDQQGYSVMQNGKLVKVPTTYKPIPTAWEKSRYMAAAPFSHGGVNYTPGMPVPMDVARTQFPRQLTWGRVGSNISNWARTPSGFNMTAGMTGMAAGMAVHAVTKDVWASAGAGIASGVGMAFGGPVGAAAGMALGAVVGKTISDWIYDTFTSNATKMKDMFKSVGEELGRDLTSIQDKYLKEAGSTTTAMFAGSTPHDIIAELNKKVPGYVKVALEGNENDKRAAAKENKMWLEGTAPAAIEAVNEAYREGLISKETYEKSLIDSKIIWSELSDELQDYISVLGTINGASLKYYGTTNNGLEVLKATAEGIKELIRYKVELALIENRYSNRSQAINSIMDEFNLVEKEKALVDSMLGKQSILGDYAVKQATALTGSGTGYASVVDAYRRLSPMLASQGKSMELISWEQWSYILQYGGDMASQFLQVAESIFTAEQATSSFMVKMKQFTTLVPEFKILQKDPSSMTEKELLAYEQTLNKVINKDFLSGLANNLSSISSPTDQQLELLGAINEYLQGIIEKDSLISRLSGMSSWLSDWKQTGSFRLVDEQTVGRYKQAYAEKYDTYRAMAEGLGAGEESVSTLIDANTGLTFRMEGNTLALQMLDQHVQELDSTMSGMQAEYNLPSWYKQPNPFGWLRSVGSSFGMDESTVMSIINDFVKNKSFATGGTIPETGPYYLHKNETVVADGLSSTNNLLAGSRRVQEISQSYLSQINLGIMGLRQEISALRQVIGSGAARTVDFATSTVGGTGDIPTYGSRGLL